MFVDNSKTPLLLSINHHPKLAVESGSIVTFPQFDLLLTEHQESGQLYWCAIEYEGHSVPSNKWPDGPFVDFTSTKLSTNVRKGSCNVDNFDPHGNNYTVKFLSTLGSKSEYVVASLTVDCKYSCIII